MKPPQWRSPPLPSSKVPSSACPPSCASKIFKQVILEFIPPFDGISAPRSELWRKAEQRYRNQSPSFLAARHQMSQDGKTVCIDYLRAASQSLCEQRESAKLHLTAFGPDAEKSDVRNAHEELLLLTCVALGASRAPKAVLSSIKRLWSRSRGLAWPRGEVRYVRMLGKDVLSAQRLQMPW